MRLPAFTIIAIVLLVGCHGLVRKKKHSPASLPSSAPALVYERAVGSFRPPPAPVLPVKQGPSPLAYIVEAGTVVRIADKETGVTLARAIAEPGNIVSVDERAGIRVGDNVLVTGPLAGGRTYEIYLENQDENVMENQLIRPGIQPKSK